MCNTSKPLKTLQSALSAAVERWPSGGVPENPSVWLSRAAYNHVVGALRQGTRRAQLAARQVSQAASSTAVAPDAALGGEIRDDLTRRLFMGCSDEISHDAQLALALKTLCGFEVREIAERLFTTEANIYKRLRGARERLRELPIELHGLSAKQLSARLPAVQAIFRGYMGISLLGQSQVWKRAHLGKKTGTIAQPAAR